MKNDIVKMSKLCDAYGKLLTEHTLEIMRYYYDYDLSLSEIAENCGISRQAVLSVIRQAENRLNDYEEKLGLVAKSDALFASLQALQSELDGNIDEAKETVKRIIDEIR